MAWTKNSKFSKKGSFRKRTRRSGRKANKVTKRLRKSVVAIVRREQETKCQQYNGVASIGAYGANVQTQGMIPLSPYSSGVAIPQGSGQGERVGNQIRVVKATLSYVLSPIGYSAIVNPLPQPQEFMLRIFSVKNENSLVTSVGNYFQQGNSSSAPNGTINDMNRIVNTDLYTQKKYVKHKIGYAAWVPTPGLSPSSGYFANNDYALNAHRTIDYTKHMAKIIKFNDNTSTPINNVTQTFIQCVNSDGTVSLSTTSSILMNYTISIWYKDA